MEDKRIILIKDSAFKSFLSDTYTFGLIGFLLYANNTWFGNRGVVAFCLIIFALISSWTKADKRIERFENIEALKKHLEETI